MMCAHHSLLCFSSPCFARNTEEKRMGETSYRTKSSFDVGVSCVLNVWGLSLIMGVYVVVEGNSGKEN